MNDAPQVDSQVAGSTVCLSVSCKAVDATQVLAVVLSGGTLGLVLVPLNLLGYQWSAMGIGLRGQVSARYGLGLSAGSDFMLFVDPARGQFTGEAVPFASLDLGLQSNPSLDVGLVVAFRVSPREDYGAPVSSYAGTGLGVDLKVLVGVGAFVSPSLLEGKEGWVGLTLMLGPSVGVSGSAAYALDGQAMAELLLAGVEPLAEVVLRRVEELATTLGAGLDAVAQVAAGWADAVEALAEEVLPVFSSQRWGLEKFPAGVNVDPLHELAFWTKVAVATNGGLDRFLDEESADAPRSVHSRLATLPMAANLPAIYAEAAAALNARYAALGNEGTIWEPSYFHDTSWLGFLRHCHDNGVIEL